MSHKIVVIGALVVIVVAVVFAMCSDRGVQREMVTESISMADSRYELTISVPSRYRRTCTSTMCEWHAPSADQAAAPASPSISLVAARISVPSCGVHNIVSERAYATWAVADDPGRAIVDIVRCDHQPGTALVVTLSTPSSYQLTCQVSPAETSNEIDWAIKVCAGLRARRLDHRHSRAR